MVIGFGIMGGWNQAQAHAQFVADIADFDLTIQEALEAGRFTKATSQAAALRSKHWSRTRHARHSRRSATKLPSSQPAAASVRIRAGRHEQR